MPNGNLLKRFSSQFFFAVRNRMAATKTDNSVSSEDGKRAFENRLIHEKSPYLLQHAHNPVDWYPWGQEAFDLAKQENKPIFLSVGYSTCHWCHVMERESFENHAVGKMMNENFVNIKVDREERPDVDRVYMTFIQAISGQGGWPMSVFLTPDLKPITGGTYFPPRDQFGRPGFCSIMQYIAKQWREKRDEILEQGEMLTEALQRVTLVKDDADSHPAGYWPPASLTFQKCFKHLDESYDPEFGGFSGAPKFPQPVYLDFLLRYYRANSNDEHGKRALEMIGNTLNFMFKGGVHDHVAKGFHRYSADRKWHVPHFEKMLYDQGQLAVVCAEMVQATGKPIFAEILEDILEYVDRDLSHPEGGFYSAEDADSLPTATSTEKKEGAFCVWTFEEIQTLLAEPVTAGSSHKMADVFCSHYNVKKGGNVSGGMDPHGELTNQNVLIVYDSVETTGGKFGLTSAETSDVLQRCRATLFETRLKRPPPHLDNKMVTSWNGFMISGFAKAGAALKEPKYIERARKAAEFALKYLWADDTGLLRSCYTQEGNVVQPTNPICGFADDYVNLIGAFLDLYECTYSTQWLQWAERFQKRMDEMFWDESSEGNAYFLSKAGDQSILVRMKEDHDGAEPSANSVAAANLVRLADILDMPEYREKAQKLTKTFSPRLAKVPFVLPKMLGAYHWLENPSTQIIIIGKRTDPVSQELLDAVHSFFLPQKVLVFLDGETDFWLRDRVKHLQDFKVADGKATAFVCQNFTCGLPVYTGEDLTKRLTEGISGPSAV